MNSMIELRSIRELVGTGKAVKIEYRNKIYWIPNKLIKSIHLNVNDQMRFDYYIPGWFAQKIGIYK